MPETWTALLFSRSEVKRAGKVLRDHAGSILTHTQDEVEHATEVLNNWRSAHAYALNAAQMGLRSRIRTTLEVQPQVAQRLKEREVSPV